MGRKGMIETGRDGKMEGRNDRNGKVGKGQGGKGVFMGRGGEGRNKLHFSCNDHYASIERDRETKQWGGRHGKEWEWRKGIGWGGIARWEERNDRSRKGWEGRKWEGTNVMGRDVKGGKAREELTRNGKIGMVSERWEGWEEKGC